MRCFLSLSIRAADEPVKDFLLFLRPDALVLEEQIEELALETSVSTSNGSDQGSG